MPVAVQGVEALKARLDALEKSVSDRLEKAIERELRAMQADVVATAPVKSGQIRAAFGSPEALYFVRRQGQFRGEYGLRTNALKKLGFYAFFVEFGTKGGTKGGFRRAGVDKRGRMRVRKFDRNVPPRAARPFIRPAFKRLADRMTRARNLAVAAAMVGAATGGG
jgi:HK97 gp10 family phage protein